MLVTLMAGMVSLMLLCGQNHGVVYVKSVRLNINYTSIELFLKTKVGVKETTSTPRDSSQSHGHTDPASSLCQSP